jgi:hypothetical protein
MRLRKVTRPDSGVWERRSLYRVLVGKLVGAEQVGTQRRRQEDLGGDKWRALMKKVTHFQGS